MASSLTPDKALSVMRLDFRREDLDLVLYGSVKPAEQKTGATGGVALSGLRIGELSYGKNSHSMLSLYPSFYLAKFNFKSFTCAPLKSF